MLLANNLNKIKCLEDFDAYAKDILPRALWEFASVGVENNLSRDNNRKAFDNTWLSPRILENVSNRSIKKKIFDKVYSAPFGISPMGACAMCGYEADLQFAKVSKAKNIPYIISGSALVPMEKIVNINSDVWFQAYVDANRSSIGALSDRVFSSGIHTLVITVDVPVPGNRRATLRNGFEYPMRPNGRLIFDAITHPKWFFKTFLRTILSSGMPHIENYGPNRGIPILSLSAPERQHIRDSLDWDDLKWLRDRWSGRLIIKGVLSAEDVKLANKVGLDGVILSNHGGRQLDTAISPLGVIEASARDKGKMMILFDSGIRRGTDVVKALALGADFVFAGRPFLFSVVTAGYSGVSHAVDLLASEIDRTIALLGCNDLYNLGSRIVRD
ncbi:MAG: alpha-hydroxy-acid oxidizing protein [Rhodospirillaceae bacterium]|nr:alpha-hydroxy-acid oxidizing protein [Rhodospirillaceae bacterium]